MQSSVKFGTHHRPAANAGSGAHRRRGGGAARGTDSRWPPAVRPQARRATTGVRGDPKTGWPAQPEDVGSGVTRRPLQKALLESKLRGDPEPARQYRQRMHEAGQPKECIAGKAGRWRGGATRKLHREALLKQEERGNPDFRRRRAKGCRSRRDPESASPAQPIEAAGGETRSRSKGLRRR